MSPIGVMDVKVAYNQITHDLKLYVVKTKGPALLGREWLKQVKLNWNSLFATDVKLVNANVISTENTIPDAKRNAEQLDKKNTRTFSMIVWEH